MKQDITPFNAKNKANGLWIHRYNEDRLCYKGQYINGRRNGYWIDNYYLSIPKATITFFLR